MTHEQKIKYWTAKKAEAQQELDKLTQPVLHVIIVGSNGYATRREYVRGSAAIKVSRKSKGNFASKATRGAFKS